MTVVDLMHERARRDVPCYLVAFERDASCIAEFVFFSENVARAIAWELRREVRRRRLDYVVERQRACVFLTDRVLCSDLEDRLARPDGDLPGRARRRSVISPHRRPPESLAVLRRD